MILSHHFPNDTFQVIIFLKSTIHLIFPGWAVSSTGQWLIERIPRSNIFTAGSRSQRQKATAHLQRSGAATIGLNHTTPPLCWRKRFKILVAENQWRGLCPTVRPTLTGSSMLKSCRSMFPLIFSASVESHWIAPRGGTSALWRSPAATSSISLSRTPCARTTPQRSCSGLSPQTWCPSWWGEPTTQRLFLPNLSSTFKIFLRQKF